MTQDASRAKCHAGGGPCSSEGLASTPDGVQRCDQAEATRQTRRSSIGCWRTIATNLNQRLLETLSTSFELGHELPPNSGPTD